MNQQETSKIILRYGAIAIVATMFIYFLARLSGNDFIVSAPPALFSPIPWWLFLGYAAGGALSMFPLIAVATKLSRLRLISYLGIFGGLGLMTSAPFLVTSDISTLIWLNLSHVALVVPLLIMVNRLQPKPVGA